MTTKQLSLKDAKSLIHWDHVGSTPYANYFDHWDKGFKNIPIAKEHVVIGYYSHYVKLNGSIPTDIPEALLKRAKTMHPEEFI